MESLQKGENFLEISGKVYVKFEQFSSRAQHCQKKKTHYLKKKLRIKIVQNLNFVQKSPAARMSSPPPKWSNDPQKIDMVGITWN